MVGDYYLRVSNNGLEQQDFITMDKSSGQIAIQVFHNESLFPPRSEDSKCNYFKSYLYSLVLFRYINGLPIYVFAVTFSRFKVYRV